MNFLAIVRRLARECDVTLDTGTPTAVTGQTGRLAQLVDWAADAHKDILSLHADPGWMFMRRSFALSTVAGDGQYAPTDCTDNAVAIVAADFNDWITDTVLRIYLTSSGQSTETFLTWMPYQDFYNSYKIGTSATTRNFPKYWSKAPNGDLLLGPLPDGVYTVSGEYQKSAGAYALAADSDTPPFHADYHMIVVYRAMMDYGEFLGAPEAAGRGERKYYEMLHRMEGKWLPSEIKAPPLVE